MLVENTKIGARSIGSLILIPGFNQVNDARWEALAASAAYKGPIAGLIEDGDLVVTDAKAKLTIATVKKTYDLDLLSSWLEDSKGPLKGAIKEQMEAMKIGQDL